MNISQLIGIITNLETKVGRDDCLYTHEISTAKTNKKSILSPYLRGGLISTMLNPPRFCSKLHPTYKYTLEALGAQNIGNKSPAELKAWLLSCCIRIELDTAPHYYLQLQALFSVSRTWTVPWDSHKNI
jgi:hypothetical protein